jgi:uncharacterized protein YjbJ (UPF0337 family)
MNWDMVAGKWDLTKGKLREKWGRLTDHDLDVTAGQRDQLIGILQQRYGKTREEAERQVAALENRLKVMS